MRLIVISTVLWYVIQSSCRFFDIHYLFFRFRCSLRWSPDSESKWWMRHVRLLLPALVTRIYLTRETTYAMSLKQSRINTSTPLTIRDDLLRSLENCTLNIYRWIVFPNSCCTIIDVNESTVAASFVAHRMVTGRRQNWSGLFTKMAWRTISLIKLVEYMLFCTCCFVDLSSRFLRTVVFHREPIVFAQGRMKGSGKLWQVGTYCALSKTG